MIKIVRTVQSWLLAREAGWAYRLYVSVLTVESVEKAFGAVRALDAASFSVASGEIHGVIGPNGSGKTTLINCISGVLRIDRGDIAMDGSSISTLPPHRIARLGLYRTFQDGPIVDGRTVLENVIFGARLYQREHHRDSQERARRAIELVGLPDDERWAEELSWAERQLLQLARCVAFSGKVLLLDEPTSGLGEEERRRIAAILLRIRDAGATILLVSHDVQFLFSIADRITALKEGRVIETGPADDIYRSDTVRSAYLGKA